MNLTLPLNRASLAAADRARVDFPAHAFADIPVGIIHIGPGAFHRAHQADHVDRLLAHDPRWGVCAVAMNSRGAIDALNAQDGLYVLAMLDNDIRYRVLAAHRQAVMASDPALMARFASPAVAAVTLTVTEKGYCLAPDGALDMSRADIQADIAAPEAPSTAIGLLVKGLKARRAARQGGLTVLSCDNLSGNGRKLAGAVVTLAKQTDPGLAGWIADNVRFPNAMVDSITPATDDALRAQVAAATGLADLWPIQREGFTSWIIEDALAPGCPDLASAGAVLTRDVAVHERAKLRMLNGSHSTLAYYGLARGMVTVAEAMADPHIRAFIDDLMREEIAPGLTGAEGLDLDAYRAALIARFRNPAIAHRLSQIAWDGSLKLPIRLLGTMAENLAAGRSIRRLALGVAAWMRFVRRAAATGGELVDPMADRLRQLGAACRDDAGADVALFLAERAVFPEALAASQPAQDAIIAGYRQVMSEEGAS